VDVIATQGESRVRENMVRKAEAASKMFTELVRHMYQAQSITEEDYQQKERIPEWL
jgi:hypothetical protein